MRHQGKGLEDHAGLIATESHQLLLIHLHHIVAVDDYIAGSRFNQAVQHPYQGRLARSGEAHYHENLSRIDSEACVLDADRQPGLLMNLLLGLSCPHHIKPGCGIGTKDLEQIFYFYLGHGCSCEK